jgi:hypothetical protein
MCEAGRAKAQGAVRRAASVDGHTERRRASAMEAPWWILLGSLPAAIVLTVLAESRRFRPPSRAAPLLSWGALVCCCGVCVGLVSGVLVHVLRLDEWLALAVAVPAGVLVLWVLAKMMDS